jgi:TonB family protein
MMSLVVILKATLVLTVGCAALLSLRSASAAARHFLCAFTLAVSVLVFFAAGMPWGIESKTFTFTVDAARALNADAGRSTGILSAIWIAGALVVALRFLIGLVYLTWQTRRATIPDYNVTAEGARVRLAAVSTPLVWGWLRPTVLMPYSSSGWTQTERDLAIAHETGHVRRYDAWSSLVSLAAQSIYWFHPLVWWLSRRMKEQQEIACDQDVLQAGAEPAAYATLLVETVRKMDSPALFGCAMVHDGKNVRRRVERILSFSRACRSSKQSRVALAAGVMLLLFTGAVLPTPAEQTYRIGGDVSAPKLISKVEPDYTKKAKREKISGTVLLSLVIGPDGTAKKIAVIRSLDSGLDKNAIKAVSKWRFEPAKKDGKPVFVQAHVEVNFRLL